MRKHELILVLQVVPDDHQRTDFAVDIAIKEEVGDLCLNLDYVS